MRPGNFAPGYTCLLLHTLPSPEVSTLRVPFPLFTCCLGEEQKIHFPLMCKRLMV